MVVSQKVVKARLHSLLSGCDLSPELPSDRDVVIDELSDDWESGIFFAELVPFREMRIYILLQHYAAYCYINLMYEIV